MNTRTKNPPPAHENTRTSAGERRRISKVTHDHRGYATLTFIEAPPEHERHVLELLESAPAVPGCDPYALPGAAQPTAGAVRTDLRKLSEWIKLTRALETQRRAAGEGL